MYITKWSLFQVYTTGSTLENQLVIYHKVIYHTSELKIKIIWFLLVDAVDAEEAFDKKFSNYWIFYI